MGLWTGSPVMDSLTLEPLAACRSNRPPRHLPLSAEAGTVPQRLTVGMLHRWLVPYDIDGATGARLDILACS